MPTSGPGSPVRTSRPSGLTVLPTLLNQWWQGWLIGGGSGVGFKGIGVDDLTVASTGYGGAAGVGWETALFTEPYGLIGASSTAAAAASNLQYRTPATATTQSGIRVDSNPIIDILMATGTPSDPAMGYRYWLGMFDQVTTLGNVASGANPAARFIAFRFDRALDTTWKAIVRNNGATTTLDTGIAVAFNTRYRLTIRVNNGTVTFQVNGANDRNTAIEVPAAATSLWPHGIAVKDATALGQILQWYMQRLIIRVGATSKFR